MNKDINLLAEEILNRKPKIESNKKDTVLYRRPDVLSAMVEMYNAGVREAAKPSPNIELDEAKKLRGYFGKNDAGAFHHWAYSLFDSIVKELEGKVATTTPLSSSSVIENNLQIKKEQNAQPQNNSGNAAKLPVSGRKKSSCDGCRASEGRRDCSLGYACVDWVPQEPCPKPKTYSQLIAAMKSCR